MFSKLHVKHLGKLISPQIIQSTSYPVHKLTGRTLGWSWVGLLTNLSGYPYNNLAPECNVHIAIQKYRDFEIKSATGLLWPDAINTSQTYSQIAEPNTMQKYRTEYATYLEDFVMDPLCYRVRLDETNLQTHK